MKRRHIIFLGNQILTNRKRIKFSAHVEGRKMKEKRVTICPILCLRKEDQTADLDLLNQKDTRGRLLTHPPRILGFRSQQRSWAQALCPFIFAALHNNAHLYNHFTDEQNEPAVPVVEEVTPNDGTPPRPAKKRRDERDPCAMSPLSSPAPAPVTPSALESSEYPELSTTSKALAVEMI